MERHKDITSQFDDSEYLLEENGRINNLEIEAKRTKWKHPKEILSYE